jgi:photosynthetic reaction center H subunit
MIQSAGSYIDTAQVVLYAFWLFFAGLIFYLHRENKREGYPLETERAPGGRVMVRGFPDVPEPKTYLSHDGTEKTLPAYRNDRPNVAVAPMADWPGAPYAPTGNPMADGVGPASYADREDKPELGVANEPIIRPLRNMPKHSISTDGPNPIGMTVFGADGAPAGKVVDAWIDEAESLVRYLETDIGGRNVLVPNAMARVSNAKGVRVASILASQFAGVPAHKSPDVITKLEEDKIAAYFCGGHLYATPARMGPLL